VALDIWIITFIALSWPEKVRWRWLRFALAAGVVAILVVLTLSSIARTITWERWWTAEQKVVAAVPVGQVRSLDPQAGIVVRDVPWAGPIAAFDNRWGLTAAVANRQPLTRIPDGFRQFTEALPGDKIRWDGHTLYRNGLAEFTADELWVWEWPQDKLEKVETVGHLFLASYGASSG